MSTEDLRLKIFFDTGKKQAAIKGKNWVAEITYEQYLEGLEDLPQKESDMLEVALFSMDEYFEKRSMELLEYMAKNEVNSEIDLAGLSSFYYKGEWITREQLFQNFL